MEGYDYDAAASTIKLEDITTNRTNREILRRLKDNDLDFVEMWVTEEGDWRSDEYDYRPEGPRDLAWLGYFIGKSTKLQKLHLRSAILFDSSNSVEKFFRGANSNRSIQTIELYQVDLSGGEIFQSMRPFFENNYNLSSLQLEGCEFRAGCARQLSLAVRGCKKSLKHVRINNVGDEVWLVEIIEALSVHPQLEKVDLSYNFDTTARGCQSLAGLLENPSCNLEKLNLYNNNVGNEGALIFANALTSNNKLKELYLCRNDITAEGWSSFSKVLCDTSSINNTFLSNHTLESLGGSPNIPTDVRSSLALNRSSEDKRQVATKKILKHHGHFDMEPFFEWELKVLPIAINWFDRARSIEDIDEAGIGNHKLGSIYQFIRAMPEIFEPTPAAGGGKRKRNVLMAMLE